MTGNTIIVPLFPLPQCVLLPGALMPLHIFEQRYRAMMAYVLDRLPSERLIATALLAEGYESTYETLAAPIHAVVCVGRLVDYRRLDDGRYDVLLRGGQRARILSEQRSGAFRLAHVRRMPAILDSFAKSAEELVESVREVMRQAVACGLVERQVIDGLADVSQSCEELIDVMTYYLLPQDEAEIKQRTLEEPDLRTRSKILVERVRQLIDDRRQIRRPPTTRRRWPPQSGDN